MCLAQPDPAIEEQGIEATRAARGHTLGRAIGHFVRAAHDEGIEGEAWIENDTLQVARPARRVVIPAGHPGDRGRAGGPGQGAPSCGGAGGPCGGAGGPAQDGGRGHGAFKPLHAHPGGGQMTDDDVFKVFHDPAAQKPGWRQKTHDTIVHAIE